MSCRSLEVNRLLVDPNVWEIPNLKAFVLGAGQEHLLLLVPLHLGDGVRVSLQDEDGLLLLEVPDSDQAVGVASNQLSPRLFSPLEASNSSLTLKVHVGFGQTFFAWCSQVKDIDRSILAARRNVILRLTYR